MLKADIDESGDIDETEFVAFVRSLQKDRKKNPDLNLRDACIALDKKHNQRIGKGQSGCKVSFIAITSLFHR